MTTPSAVGGHPSKEGNFVGGELEIAALSFEFRLAIRSLTTPSKEGNFVGGGRWVIHLWYSVPFRIFNAR
jgi:hypothetical protein